MPQHCMGTERYEHSLTSIVGPESPRSLWMWIALLLLPSNPGAIRCDPGLGRLAKCSLREKVELLETVTQSAWCVTRPPNPEGWSCSSPRTLSRLDTNFSNIFRRSKAQRKHKGLAAEPDRYSQAWAAPWPTQLLSRTATCCQQSMDGL
jgi:hypothetical protein